MRLSTSLRRSLLAVGISLAAALPQQLHATPFGAIGRAIAEQLGLLVSMVPDQLPLNTPLTITVLNPTQLEKQGLTGLKANDQVRVTLLDGGKLSIVPILKASTTQTTISSTTAIKTATTISPTTTTLATKQSLMLTVDARGTITSTQIVPLDATLNLTAPILKR